MAGSSSIEASLQGSGVLARISGEMDYDTSPTLVEQINTVLAHGAGFVVLDLSDVSFCDSAGLNVLLRAARRAASHDVELAVACVPQPLRQLLHMTGADQVLQVFDTAAQAQTELDRGGAVNHRA